MIGGDRLFTRPRPICALRNVCFPFCLGHVGSRGSTGIMPLYKAGD